MRALKAGRVGILAGALVVVVGSAVYLYGKLEGEMPTLNVMPQPVAIGRQGVFNLVMEDKGSGLKDAKVTVEQAGKTVSVLAETFEPGTSRAERTITLAAESLGLQDGPALLRVQVRDLSWRGGNPRALEASILVDTRPPVITVLSRFHYLNQGGAGLVVLRASEPLARCGVRVGERFFDGYPLGGDGGWGVLFAVAHDASAQVPIILEAEDAAGNSVRTRFPYSVRPKKFRHDSIRLTEEFLQRILPYFQERDPGLKGDLQEVFLRVNRELRAANERTLENICTETAKQPLWSGSFLRMANAKPMAGFADRRTYLWKDRAIDEQVHLGVDLASLVMSPVEAANKGRVVFAGELGIYGNTVVLDHGWGLFSMYSHLTQISTTVGQVVEKGERLGISGSTGLAGGDHLHFGMMVKGVFVNPIEWWDPHWVKDNIEDKLALLRSTPG